jgi:hypothetical protein
MLKSLSDKAQILFFCKKSVLEARFDPVEAQEAPRSTTATTRTHIKLKTLSPTPRSSAQKQTHHTQGRAHTKEEIQHTSKSREAAAATQAKNSANFSICRHRGFKFSLSLCSETENHTQFLQHHTPGEQEKTAEAAPTAAQQSR